MDRHRLGRTEEDREGRERGGMARQANSRAGVGRDRQGAGAVLVPSVGLRGR